MHAPPFDYEKWKVWYGLFPDEFCLDRVPVFIEWLNGKFIIARNHDKILCGTVDLLGWEVEPGMRAFSLLWLPTNSPDVRIPQAVLDHA